MKHLFFILLMIILNGCGVDKDTSLSSLRQQAFEEFVALPYKEESTLKGDVKKVVLEYVKNNSINADFSELNNFINCVMYNIWQKDPSQTLSLPLQACTNEFNNGGLKKKSYKDPSWILGQFDTVKGEHYLASKYIKKQLNDPKSYEFVEGTYNILQDGAHVLVTTEYIAKNVFGGKLRSKTGILFSNYGEILAVY